MTFANPVDPEASFLGKGDYFKMPGVYKNKMPVWEQASTADTRGLFLFYDQLEYWVAGASVWVAGAFVWAAAADVR